MKPFHPSKAAEYPALIGCDEVGRGCLVAAVVVAAVWFDPQQIPPTLLAALDDSKRLSEKVRVRLTAEIMQHCHVAIAASSPRMIDRVNIRMATLDAMRRAINKLVLADPTRVARIDGVDVPEGLLCDGLSVIKGDQLVPQIAAASIVAKTVRDDLMVRLGKRYPGYGWENNAGYGAKIHMDALENQGATPHHRFSFAPVAKTRLMYRVGLRVSDAEESQSRGAIGAKL